MGQLKYKWRECRPELVSGVVYGIVRAIMRTVRLKSENEPEHFEGKILCGWHGRSMQFAYRFRNRGYWVIISHSRDGDIQTSIFTRLGFQIIRGSTGRGGVRAAVEAIRTLKNGGTMAITPDGPRGPSGVVQGGVMLMAHKSGAELVALGLAARPCIRINSWDKYMVPLPFAKGRIVFSDPITVPPDATPEQIEEIRLRLEQVMHAVEQEAERKVGNLRD